MMMRQCNGQQQHNSIQKAEREFVENIEEGRVHCQVEIEAPTMEKAAIFLNVYAEAGQTCNLRQPVVYSLKLIKAVERGSLAYADSRGEVVVRPPQSVGSSICTRILRRGRGRKESCGLSMNSQKQT